MQDESILNTIMSDNQTKDLSGFNVVVAVAALLEQLNKREQDVLKRRFGLFGEEAETLESIGQRHKLTRERIRQIESGSVNKLKKSAFLEERLGALRQLANSLAEEHGGLVEKNYLFAILSQASQADEEKTDFEPYFEFILSRLFNDHFEATANSAYFSGAYKLKYQDLTHLDEVAAELTAAVSRLKKLHDTLDLIALVKSLPAYTKHQAKFSAPNNFDVRPLAIQADKGYNEQIHNDRVIYSLIKALNAVEQNRFGQWGHREWRDVKPKTINDKIYLVLKNHGEPMYYGDIAKKIAELGFDGKKVNTATTHNELILDDKYILVGRGLYGLKEWGYKEGTVADIIAGILAESQEPLSKEEIMKKVTDQRLVKQTTVNLALMNKERFTKTPDGKYKLADKA